MLAALFLRLRAVEESMSAWTELLKDLDDETKKLTSQKNLCLGLMLTTLGCALEQPAREHGGNAANEDRVTFEALDQEVADLTAVMDKIRTILSNLQTACQPQSRFGRWFNTPRAEEPPLILLENANRFLRERREKIDKEAEELKCAKTKPLGERLKCFTDLGRTLMIIDICVKHIHEARVSIAQIYHD